MREIKFRVWNKNTQEMDEYIYDLIFKNDEQSKEIHLYKDEVLMQFTGKQDNGCNEIYEDDIVTVLGDIARVIWLNDAWYYQKKDGHLQPLGDFGSTAYNVIGNIYENQELLNG